MILQPLDTVDNKAIRRMRHLLDSRTYRDKQQLAVIEGVRLVEAALAAGVRFRDVVYSPRLVGTERGRSLLMRLQLLSDRMVYVTDRVLDTLSLVEADQGIMAAIPWSLPVHKTLPPLNDVLVVAWGVQDPGNLGTLIRSVHAAGFQAFAVTAGTVDTANPKVLRASAGSIFSLPIWRLEEGWLEEALKSGTTSIRATVVNGGQAYTDVDWMRPSVLLLGNEGNGLPAHLAQQTEAITIPMNPAANSLNVAVAGSVMVFHAAWQRRSH
ncbi:MAG: RNA methyltransferase [Firmicutes bacterium]|nr:RNA methyltransferase [Bacillota bacterium]